MTKPIDQSRFPTTPADLEDPAFASRCKVVVTNATIVAQGDVACVVTKCTHCGKPFPVALRQERTRAGKPYRSIPQCLSCRGRYARKRKATSPAADCVVYASVNGRAVPVGELVL